MRYLVWIPKNADKQLTGQLLLNSVGLDDHTGLDVVQSTGPGGSAGWLFAWLSPDQPNLAYKPDEQIWIPSLADGDRPAGAYHVGIWKEKPPTEADVRRPDHRKGTFVPMADGTRWLFPTESGLERFPNIVDGRLQWVVDERFNWFVTDLQRRKAMLTRDPEDPGRAFVSWNLEEDFAFLVRALRINYRLTPEVVVHLKLISESVLKNLTVSLLGFTLND
jgi:hypothetical protein